MLAKVNETEVEVDRGVPQYMTDLRVYMTKEQYIDFVKKQNGNEIELEFL